MFTTCTCNFPNLHYERILLVWLLQTTLWLHVQLYSSTFKNYCVWHYVWDTQAWQQGLSKDTTSVYWCKKKGQLSMYMYMCVAIFVLVSFITGIHVMCMCNATKLAYHSVWVITPAVLSECDIGSSYSTLPLLWKDSYFRPEFLNMDMHPKHPRRIHFLHIAWQNCMNVYNHYASRE